MSNCSNSSRIDETEAFDSKELTHIAGVALAELNVIEPSESLLEPVARAIRSLNHPQQSEKRQWSPR
jgi:hypothetical protein